MQSWVCQWRPFWIPVGDSFKKAFVEECVFISGESSDGQNVMDVPVLHSTDHSDCIPELPRILKQLDSLPWEPTRPQDKAYFWERIEAPLRPLWPRLKCNFIHPHQLSSFHERLELTCSNEVIFSGFKEIAWVKMSDREILVQR